MALFNEILLARENGFITIPSKSGWNRIEFPNEVKEVFVTKNLFCGFPADILPESIQHREMLAKNHMSRDKIYDMIKIVSKNLKLKILLALRFISLLLYFFSAEGIKPKHIIIAESSKCITPEVIIAMLKTNDFSTTVTQSLNFPKTKVAQKLDSINDGVAVFQDTGNIEDTKKRKAALECIIEDIQHANDMEKYSRHLIAVISKYAGREIPPEYICRLSFDDVNLKFNVPVLQDVCREIDAIFIRYITEHFKEVRDKISSVIAFFKKSQDKGIPDDRADIYLFLIGFNEVFMKVFGKSFMNSVEIGKIKKWLNESVEYSSIAYAVTAEFQEIINEGIILEKFKVIEKKGTVSFEKDKNYLITSNDIVSMEPELIERMILPKMQTTQNIYQLVNALDECEVLYKTKKQHHPINVYTSKGESVMINAYSVKQSILTLDNLSRIKNLPNKRFFFKADEIRDNEFIPLLVNSDREVAGMRFNKLEAGHTFITGKTGYRKTTMIARIIASRAYMNHRVVIFDASGAFSEAELKKHFPQKFIENYIDVYDIGKKEQNGEIPVNLFSLKGCDSLPEKKKAIVGVLSAAMKDLTESKIRKLRKVISEMLKEKDDVQPSDILASLSADEEDATYASLLNRLESVMEDINEYGMSSGTWDDIFPKSKNIVIVRTSSSYASKDNPLVDMLIATLYHYQELHNEIPLAIVLDEIQDQNFAKGSPNCQILEKGRKYGASLICATLHYRNRGCDYGETMSNVDINIFMKPTSSSIGLVASELGYQGDKIDYLKRMDKGDCIISCNFYDKEEKENCPAVLVGKVPDESVIPAVKGYQRIGNAVYT
ncbi:MAG: type IV secretion system DNA-binding domain-containing protein [Oscillospiraceae bacterium]